MQRNHNKISSAMAQSLLNISTERLTTGHGGGAANVEGVWRGREDVAVGSRVWTPSSGTFAAGGKNARR